MKKPHLIDVVYRIESLKKEKQSYLGPKNIFASIFKKNTFYSQEFHKKNFELWKNQAYF
jgi:hypothetical protein